MESPKIPVVTALDHGLMVGDGVFETIKIERGEPFALTRHLTRLAKSADGLGIGQPDEESLRRAVTLTTEGIEFGRTRVTVTSGQGPLGSARGNSGVASIVVSEACERPSPITSIVTVRWPRNERGALAGLKTTSYAENALMVEYAQARGASEAVMPNTTGQLCEGTGSNIFYVLNGQLVTPTLNSGCLAGITRALLMQWCTGELNVVERDAPIEVLREASEVFLVSTTRDVQSVSSVDGRVMDAPGPITQRVQRIWAREALKNFDP